MAGIIVFASGLLFAVGLGVSGMTDPAKVRGFMDVTGAWDPTLGWVMVGAVASHMLAYRLIVRRKAPILAPKFGIPTRRDLDARLLVGAALFGAGWGLGGFCPGPGLVSLASGGAAPLVFVASMLGGMWAFNVWEGLVAARVARRVAAQAA